MYSVLAILFVIGVLLLLAGFLGRIGTNGIGDVSENVAATLGLLVTYCFLILSLSSFSELAGFFDGICGGIPYLDEIADYGSLQNVLREDPLAAVIAFLDSVILSVIVEIIMLLPLTQGNATGKVMVRIFTGVVVGIVSLLIFNYVIKASAVYQWVVFAIGIIISLVSVCTIPMILFLVFKKNNAVGVSVIGIGLLLLFSQSKIAGIFRSAFFKAIVYVCGIWILEKYFGTVANALSKVSAVFVAFGPVLVMLVGLVFILKCLKS